MSAAAPRSSGSGGVFDAALGLLRKDDERAWMCADWLVRVRAPTWLELAGVGRRARALRRLAPVRDRASAEAAVPALAGARAACAPPVGQPTGWDAVWSARFSVAAQAARAAALEVTAEPAWTVVRRGAGFAGWDAARDAIGDAVWDAMLIVAWDAAWEAPEDDVRAAALQALSPTAAGLEHSAMSLLERLVDARRL